ncbi:Nif3-like dinuclear metal center hexameric protein [Pontibacter qinzhouensis]|uniref:GTP cyclohydrolase 1 type 2 homolog n=1 Tax=Pontibacter qinzhouensis TaxID=2603253 RepID=A0A5C8K9I1_9BACT|nr:Nif3-like dinuclear metal center hexameric protein [Pontibacter qinzhouensis]TXK45791.1 Nif3-like dinuclear metal center hexameric protein [Pontibacter qinzhouensis]
MATIADVIKVLEHLAPPSYQESYDNVGLQTGDRQQPVTGVLVTLDCTEAVLDEAIEKGCNLVVAHHPVIFKGLKQLTGRSYVERTLIKAIKHDIAIYACHTNLDSVHNGVNYKIAQKLELQNAKVLVHKPQTLMQLVTFSPPENTAQVLQALHQAGAGQIGEYRNCSFQVEGTGQFLPTANAAPAIGEVGKLKQVPEDRLEVIFPAHLQHVVLAALRQAHPYEEVAHYLTSLENLSQEVGIGMIGELPAPLQEADFLQWLKEKMQLAGLRYTSIGNKKISRVAVCGGAGSFLIQDAKRKGADALVTGDVKYHEFFDADGKLMIADIGHYESEVYTKEIFYDTLSKNFTTFAVYLSIVNTNPVRYTF